MFASLVAVQAIDTDTKFHFTMNVNRQDIIVCPQLLRRLLVPMETGLTEAS